MNMDNRANLRRLILTSVAVVMAMIMPAVAASQSVSKRLENIEKQLKAVQRKVFKAGSEFPRQDVPATSSQKAGAGDDMAGRVNFADIEARISQLETQLRQLTGRIEEGNYQTDNLKQQMETMARDYEFRFKELEKSAAAKTSARAPSGAEAVPLPAKNIEKNRAVFLPDGSEKEQYSYAQKLVTKGQYAEAERALEEFLKRHPKATLAGNAQYWLGQTYYVRKAYTKATRAFLEGYNSYPKSQKAPAFLLKIGMSLNAMGEKKDACDAYRELGARFPDSMENKVKRPPEEKRAGCS